jgi:signal transduction histidine kinase
LNAFALSTSARPPESWSENPAGDEPARGAAPAGEQQHERMFEVSHLYGPLIGLALCGWLAWLGFPLDYRLLGFSLLVCAFWLYPPLVRRTGRYRLLSLASLHQLMLVILWASHGYGGLASPFLLWLALVPLLGFLYLPPRLGLWGGLVVSLAAHLAGFVAVSIFVARPPPVPAVALQSLALLSVVCASAYVAMMAIYFGRVLTSRRELQQQAVSHRGVAAELARIAQETRRAGDDKLAMIRRLSTESAGPLASMQRSSASLLAADAAETDRQESRSVAEAVEYLRTLICDTERYADVDGGELQTGASRTSVPAALDQAAARTRQMLKPPAQVALHIEEGLDDRVESCSELVAEAVFYVCRHYAQAEPDRGLELCAARLLVGSAEHLVIDVGPGCTAGEAEAAVTIFDAETLERPSAASIGGYGLSLALAHRICTRLGGSLLASGRPAETRGFRVLVPVDRQESARS